MQALIDANPPGAIQAASDSFLRQAVAAVCAIEPEPTLWHVYAMLDFADGATRVLITKPSIAAFGLNWQHCARMAFVGLSDSYETYYQSIRRCWRYGQTRPVDAHIVLSRLESQIATNVRRKETQARAFTAELVDAMRAAATWKELA